MPNFDCGAYFLSTLIPVKTGAIGGEAAASGTSPVHAMRAALAALPTARQSPHANGDSPFAKNTRNHFARMVVIEDVAYVGRQPINSLVTVLTELLLPPRLHVNPVTPQKQDHLSNPFLFFSADFDAASGDDSERDSYLKELWTSSGAELREIFQYCERFDEVADADSFARYIARCQLKTVMPFHDYFMDGVPLAALPEMSMKKMAAILAGVALLSFVLLHTLVWSSDSCLALFLKTVAALIAGGAAVYVTVMQAGDKPFPAAPESTLPVVLKSLYLKDRFTRFVIDNQMLAAAEDDESARRLQRQFAAFADAQRPDDIAQPTQAPGAVGMGA